MFKPFKTCQKIELFIQCGSVAEQLGHFESNCSVRPSMVKIANH